MKPINVLSLFDGMSCGQIALTELGVPINRYYASEIDKFAIKQTQYNFPNTIQLGNIENWREWDIDWRTIDLILAGTPCQGFSFAGKQLAFDDPRSRLFFVFVDILNHIRKLNPDVKFLLENVNMKKSHLEVISRYTGVFPVRINSNLVSAQNRDRWYWTNVQTKQVGLFGEVYSDIPQPKDRGILLRDILEKDVDEKYYLSDKGLSSMINHKETNQSKGNGFGYSYSDGNSKSNTILSRYYKDGKEQLIIQFGRGKNKGGVHQDKTPTVSSDSWEQNNLHITEAIQKGYTEIRPSECFDAENPKSKTRRGRKMEFKANCLMADKTNFMQYTADYRIRRLTPTECARLQTIPDWYEWIVSDTQIYKQCGNGWTIEVIKHILSQWDLVNESVLTKAI